MQRVAVERRQAIELIERALAQRQCILVEERQARATLPSAAAAAASICGSAAGRPTAAASAAATSVCANGRSVTMRQRERSVAGTRAAEWLTSSNRARCGGSSSTLSSALAPDRLSSSTASTMAIRHPPSPAVAPKNETVRRTSSTAICCRKKPLSLGVRSMIEEVALRLRRDPARHRMPGIDG